MLYNQFCYLIRQFLNRTYLFWYKERWTLISYVGIDLTIYFLPREKIFLTSAVIWLFSVPGDVSVRRRRLPCRRFRWRLRPYRRPSTEHSTGEHRFQKTHTYTHTHTHIHTHPHTRRTGTHTHIYTHTHIHTHTH